MIHVPTNTYKKHKQCTKNRSTSHTGIKKKTLVSQQIDNALVDAWKKVWYVIKV